jgi:hypothetical protein
VRGEQLNFRVTNDALGGDPARGERKVLTILYVLDGQFGRAFANEGDMVSVSGSGMGGMPGGPGPINQPGPGIWWPGSGNYQDLQILEASYGVRERRADVTSRLASLVRNGSLEVRVTDDTMGVDPARGEVKRLRVIYLWQGLRYQTNVPQGGTLSIP